jgi:hypothetical protein
VVVGEVALLALVPADAEVGDQVVGRDDRLGLERDARRGDADERAQSLEQLVDLRLVQRARPDALPQEGHRVEPQHVDAGVGQVHDRLGHRDEHVRVPVVEVPLVRVERRPHPALELRHPGEVAGR